MIATNGPFDAYQSVGKEKERWQNFWAASCAGVNVQRPSAFFVPADSVATLTTRTHDAR
jgi:hypothetical protein